MKNMMELNTDIKNKPFLKKSGMDLRSYVIILALAGIWIGLQIATNGTFLSARNLSSLFTQMSYIAVIAVGMVLVIVSGYIDLSVGSVVAFCGAVSAIMQVKLGMGTIPSIIVPIVIGVGFTAWNGYWAAYHKIPAFIVTLSSMLIFRGLTLKITDGVTIAPVNQDFRVIGEGYLPSAVGIGIAILGIVIYLLFEIKKRKNKISKGLESGTPLILTIKIICVVAIILAFVLIMNSYKGIPVPVIILIIATLIMAFIALKTRFGRRLYAIGGNPEAARLSGINIRKEALKIYLVLGGLCAVSGLILTARLNAATASAGNQFEFDAISAAIIGGTSFMGGEGTVFGAIIGSLIMASLNNGMSLLNMDMNNQYIIKGLVLLIAVWFDIAARNKGKA
ncbi:MAG: sugar ABC transporter permease [Clostridia bacterium]|nr:sugar ABC transporter permease [Clostridia bacterium]